MSEEKSKILILGGTGYIGKFIVKASCSLGHPTLVLVRDLNPSDPAKAKLLDEFKSSGVKLIQGDLTDYESLVNVLRQVDVVISAVGIPQLKDQWKLLDAIKEVTNIKRFLPSEFGGDVDHTKAVEPAKSMIFDIKVQFRRAVEASGIPYTFISSYFFAGYFLPTLGQAESVDIHKDSKVTIYGDGNAKVIFVDEGDIGRYTIKAVDDPRTLNKVVHIRPPANIVSQNELVSLWETKNNRVYERVYVSEDEIMKQIPKSSFPVDLLLSFSISTFIKGEHTNFGIDPSVGVEATALYPDVKYITIDEYLSKNMCSV